jgi:3-octaprenyl-4-hydroxybenzoate carboxy-lyase
MKVVILCGQDPLPFMLASSPLPEVSEYDIAGALRSGSIDVARGEVPKAVYLIRRKSAALRCNISAARLGAVAPKLRWTKATGSGSPSANGVSLPRRSRLPSTALDSTTERR